MRKTQTTSDTHSKWLEQHASSELTHRHGGNGWAVIEDIDSEWCRVVSVGKNTVGKQAFLASKDRLKPFAPLNDAVIGDVLSLRREIALGQKEIVKSWIVQSVNKSI